MLHNHLVHTKPALIIWIHITRINKSLIVKNKEQCLDYKWVLDKMVSVFIIYTAVYVYKRCHIQCI